MNKIDFCMRRVRGILQVGFWADPCCCGWKVSDKIDTSLLVLVKEDNPKSFFQKPSPRRRAEIILGSEAGGRTNGLHRRMEMRIWSPAVKTVHSAENLQTWLQKGNCSPGTQLGRKPGRRSWQLLICHLLQRQNFHHFTEFKTRKGH